MNNDPLDPRYLLAQRPVSSVGDDRGVDIELLASEIGALRGAAQRYADAGSEGTGLDLENAAIRYVRKLDDEHYRAQRPDYAAIIRAAERERADGNGEN